MCKRFIWQVLSMLSTLPNRIIYFAFINREEEKSPNKNEKLTIAAICHYWRNWYKCLTHLLANVSASVRSHFFSSLFFSLSNVELVPIPNRFPLVSCWNAHFFSFFLHLQLISPYRWLWFVWSAPLRISAFSTINPFRLDCYIAQAN